MYVVAVPAIKIIATLSAETLVGLDPVQTLSPREREVYDLVCEGLSNREIASSLFISEATVKVHVHHVFDKLGIRSRTALAMNAVHERTASGDVDLDTGGLNELVSELSRR